MAGKSGPSKRKQRRSERAKGVKESDAPETSGTEDVVEPVGEEGPPRQSGTVSSGAKPLAGFSWPLWQRLSTALGVVLCMVVVGWVVSLPSQLLGAEGLAEREVRRGIGRQVGSGKSEESKQAVDGWIKENPDEFAKRKEAYAEGLRENATFTYDGERVLYPLGYDGYLWMRHARNLLEKGTTCDAVVEGRCWDTLTLAPVGGEMIYARSVHIVAMAGLHLLLGKVFGVPLEVSAAALLILVAALSVIPAFFIGRRLGGPWCGVVGALFAVCNAPAISRITAPDNDVWNVLLPLSMSCFLLEALHAEKPKARWSWVVAAAAVAAVQLVSWRGGTFAHLVVLGTLGAAIVTAAVRSLREGRRRVWREPAVKSPVFGLALYLLASSLVVALLGGAEVYSELTDRVWDAFGISGGGGPTHRFPSGLETVSELARYEWWRTVDRFGQRPFLFAVSMGMTLMFLPRGNWLNSNLLPVVGSAVASGILQLMDDPSRGQVLGLVFGPPALVGLRSVLTPSFPARSIWAPTLVAIWGLGGTYLMLSANRFELLATPMYGLAAIAGVERVAGWVRGAVVSSFGSRAGWVVYAVGACSLAWSVSKPVTYAREVSRDQLPRLTDAWHDTFTDIRDRSANDAIINLWWDQGHWAKYYADRRVISDGGTLRAQVHHWFSKALLAPPETSVGLLRMIDCGSDTVPFDTGTRGAFGKLTAFGLESSRAYDTVEALASLDRDAAAKYLREQGLDETQATDVLGATHCTPPEAYLALDSLTIHQAKIWTRVAEWRPGQEVRQSADYAAARWLPCTEVANGLRCRVGARLGGAFIQGFTFDSADPTRSVVHSVPKPGESVRVELPEALLVARNGSIAQVAGSGAGGVGVLLDPERKAVLVGGPELLRSTFTRLVFLGEQYAPQFPKVGDRTNTQGLRVRSWRISW